MDPLPRDSLRWRCDPQLFPFETTESVEPQKGVVGQDDAVDALRFGLECDAPGQNVFVRGLVGTGRMTLVAQVLEELRPTCTTRLDHCYVRNFDDPRRPRLISLPGGAGKQFRQAAQALAEFVRDRLQRALEDEAVQARVQALEAAAAQRIEKLTEPFRKRVEKAGLAMVSVQAGDVAAPAVFPVVEGKPVAPEELERLHAEGAITKRTLTRFVRAREKFERQLRDIVGQVRVLRREHEERVRAVAEETTREVLADHVDAIRTAFPQPRVAEFLDGLVEDVIRNRIGAGEAPDPLRVYGVNLVLDASDGDACPVVIESTALLTNLLGTIERTPDAEEGQIGDHLAIRGGSLLHADRGYLVLDVRDLISVEHAWQSLVRTLRSGMLEIVPPEVGGGYASPLIKPDPIPVRVRVILLGDADTYSFLDQNDPEFEHLFKVLADFRSVMSRRPDAVVEYARVLARIAKTEDLPPFDRVAVAELVEHGARIASRTGKLTARIGRVADIAREAAFLARREGLELVTHTEVREAVRRTKTRARLASVSFREMVETGALLIETQGSVVGQLNGLAVMHAGPLTYGFPARITATVGPGAAGVVNIEQQARLSGAIHTKGFHILRGLLRHLLRPDHPLTFSASLAFEQSYGGIDGDSASGAEFCCFLSALTKVPIRQGVAMTGAIDQLGHVQAIGGVNEKVEGFYDTCVSAGLTGEQGVIVPDANAGDLMLRHDVVDACTEGRFHVWAVGTIVQALRILTGMKPGSRNSRGKYPKGTLLARAEGRVRQLWLESLREPAGAGAAATKAPRRSKKKAAKRLGKNQ